MHLHAVLVGGWSISIQSSSLQLVLKHFELFKSWQAPCLRLFEMHPSVSQNWMMGQRTGTPIAKIKNIQKPGFHMFSYVFLYVDCSLNHSIKFKLVTKLHTPKPASLCPIWSGLCSRLAVPMLPKIKRPERYQLRSPTSKGVQGVPVWFQDILRHLEHCITPCDSPRPILPFANHTVPCGTLLLSGNLT
jgi:hypothetical protein